MSSQPRSGASHETLWRAEAEPTTSNRKFGLTFTAVFLALALLALWRHNLSRAGWEAALAAGFLLAALTLPAILAPLNGAWSWFGRRLNAVVSPVFLVVLFYGVVTPVGWLMRLAGKDPLQRSRDPHATSYWIEAADKPRLDMNRQF